MNGLRNLLKGKGFGITKEAFNRTVLLGKFLCFLHVTETYICRPVLSYGPSMLPTLSQTGDLILVEKISPRLGKVNNGDIVSVRSPENPKMILTKRIWAWKETMCQRDIFGSKETTCITHKIHANLVLFHTVLFKARCFVGFGRSVALDRWAKKSSSEEVKTSPKARKVRALPPPEFVSPRICNRL
ncbi:hypothetical protein C5167_023791 [Papaver somniferum]|uniref:Peptidase S26 domain-containing protein n=1 Tax=Papaver somniferum TaxID=3469 RepID=A0A4Y7JMP9_PAPSO|nr:hypothetical protein C5167_023791 [Papaver somniferum]